LSELEQNVPKTGEQVPILVTGRGLRSLNLAKYLVQKIEKDATLTPIEDIIKETNTNAAKIASADTILVDYIYKREYITLPNSTFDILHTNYASENFYLYQPA